jgi:predicted HAD superfamily Cof-like phosphohydrolase
MIEQIKMVEDFGRIFGLHINETLFGIVDEKTIALRFKLIDEELRELKEAVVEGDREHILKEYSDLLYVVFGFAVNFGIQDVAVEAFKRVHESNLSKLDENGKPIYNENGKVVKGPNYKEPTMEGLTHKNVSIQVPLMSSGAISTGIGG